MNRYGHEFSKHTRPAMEEDDRNSIYSLGEKRNEVDIKDLIMAAYGHHEVRERVHVPLMFPPDSEVSILE